MATLNDAAHNESERFGETEVRLPRVAIKFCVQCKWNLRAAYYAQELLSTFSTALGEVSLIPATGGTFTITLFHRPPSPPLLPIKSATTTSFPLEAGKHSDDRPGIAQVILWDRKTDGGFPETKELKNRVRNVVEPGRDLGHVDRSLKKEAAAKANADPSRESAEAEKHNLESSDGEGGGVGVGGEPATSGKGNLQGDVDVKEDMRSTTQVAEKCEDCH